MNTMINEPDCSVSILIKRCRSMIRHLRWVHLRAVVILIQASVLFYAAPANVNAGENTYFTSEDFLTSVFSGPIKPSTLWLPADAQKKIASIIGHPPVQLRQRYWTDGHKTVWILEEIGKEEPITAGFVLSEGRIQQVNVLIYRESRGMEIRSPGFLKQYGSAGLGPDNRLDRTIDAISGATLSVAAMERMAREALFLDHLTREK
jgi:hypothetical protein